MIKLDITNGTFHFNFVFERRLNFIQGDSATGKTTFYRLMDLYLRGESSIRLDSTFKVELVSLLNLNYVSYMHDSIILVDDLEVIMDDNFVKIIKNDCIKNNLWFVIMSREDAALTNEGARLSFSSNSIYKLVSENKYYYLESLYRHNFCIDDNHDIVIVEDEKSGYKFFRKLFSPIKVVSAKSKSRIITCVEEAINEGYSNILAIFDTASYGCHMSLFNNLFKDCDENVSYISKYECFEELLVRLNINRNNPVIVKELSNLYDYANNFVSWETYFEDLIQRATKNKFYKYTHSSKLRSCYTESCSLCNEHMRAKCDYYSENKLYDLLNGTKYEFLTYYLQDKEV
jgi:hypothetical protein